MGQVRRDRKPGRQKQALERQTAWAGMSPKEQLKSLDERLGKGIGAVKQRARIAKARSKPAETSAA